MNRETLTTIGGLVVVGAIVVATFLYGNHQRQQNMRDESQKQHQQEQATQSGQQSGVSQSNGTAAVQKPTDNTQSNLQGGQSSTTPGKGGGTAVTTPNPSTTPATGAGTNSLLGGTLIISFGYGYMRSRKRLTV